MLGKLAAYAIAFLVLAGIPLVFFPFSLALAMGTKKTMGKWAAPFVFPVLDAFQIACGVLIAEWVIHKIGQPCSWLMFLVPGCLMVQNDLMRINRVRAGTSNVERILERGGEPQSYDQRHDLWVERGRLVGDVVGWIVGTSLVLRSAPFF